MRRYQDKLLIQMVVCLAIFALIRMSSVIGGEKVDEIKNSIRDYAETNYSIEDIRNIGDELAQKAVNAPETLVSVITQANEAGEFAAPINEKDRDDIKTVHAAGDGNIIYAGIDKNLGMCVRVQHEDKVSVYGNLYTLTTITGEQVKKGDIIGTFDSKAGKEFYYQLE
ncbi:MAG: hypothetical protein DBY08_01875 [Clostridiales bacterium]|nr:MAG: hypothetical protein DBY08_01875 [Clostridiales bacterium]